MDIAGYLGVTIERDLTPAGKDVLARTFLPRSEAGGAQTPERAGVRSGVWQSPVYRPDAPAVVGIRGKIAAALYANQDVEIVCIGDSKTVGTGTGTGKRPDRSWPGVLRRSLSAVEGFITASPAAEDDRWTSSNMDRGAGYADDGLATITPGTPTTLTFAYTEPHTGGAFFITSTDGATVQVTVDGGAPQTLTVPAGTTLQEVVPTVTGDTTHTYALTSTDTIRVRGFRPAFSGPKLKITNLGRAGSAPSLWIAGGKLWDGFRTIIPAPDVILCQHGTNGTTGIPDLFTQIVGVTDLAVVIAPGGIGVEADPQYAAMYLSVWDQADAHGLPLIDFASVIGNHTEADARGLMADTVHENQYGHAWNAAAVLGVLASGLSS